MSGGELQRSVCVVRELSVSGRACDASRTRVERVCDHVASAWQVYVWQSRAYRQHYEHYLLEFNVPWACPCTGDTDSTSVASLLHLATIQQLQQSSAGS